MIETIKLKNKNAFIKTLKKIYGESADIEYFETSGNVQIRTTNQAFGYRHINWVDLAIMSLFRLRASDEDVEEFGHCLLKSYEDSYDDSTDYAEDFLWKLAKDAPEEVFKEDYKGVRFISVEKINDSLKAFLAERLKKSGETLFTRNEMEAINVLNDRCSKDPELRKVMISVRGDRPEKLIRDFFRLHHVVEKEPEVVGEEAKD